MALREPEDISEVKFFTRQVLTKRGSKEPTGSVFLWCYKNSNEMQGKYTCPYCGHKGEVRGEFKVPFKFECEKCGKKIRVDKLRKSK